MSFFRYLRDRLLFVALYAGLLIFFTAMVYLGGSGSDAFYTAVVSFVLWALVMVVDYTRCRRRALRLFELAGDPGPAPELPPPLDRRDEGYRRLIEAIQARCRAETERMEEDYRQNKEFMVAWAHEVKTPLTAARLLLEGMDDRTEADSLLEEISRIDQSVERVLYHSRSDSFSRDYLIAEEPLLSLVRENVKKHKALFIRKHIAVAIDVPDGLAVHTDRKWLLFIMDQLLSNALKYTGEGGRIDITAIRSGRETILRYRDSGRGIPAEDIERVFASSFTGRNGREPGSASTGLGLYLAGKLARKMDHRITLSSQPGEGTAADIHFPMLGDFLRP